MTVSATLGGVFLKGTAAARPAANAVAGGTVYSATDTGVITQSDGSSWSTWATISAGMADPMTTRGDFIYRNASNVTARFPLALAGKVIGSDGTDLVAVYPPKYQFDYKQITANVTVAGTSEGSPTTIMTGNAVTYDGSTKVRVRFVASSITTAAVAGGYVQVFAVDGATILGTLAVRVSSGATAGDEPVAGEFDWTPSAAAHTVTIKAHRDASAIGTAAVIAGAGGSGTRTPAFLEIVKV